jgi:hypothetical protein
MKSLLSSSTVVGALIALISKVVGIKSGDVHGIYDSLMLLWPVLVGVAADLTGMWSRIKQSNFDRGVFQRPAFWAQILSAVVTAAAAFGVDLSSLEAIFSQSLAHGPAIASLIGSVIAIIGSLRATKPIDSGTIPRAVIVRD